MKKCMITMIRRFWIIYIFISVSILIKNVIGRNETRNYELVPGNFEAFVKNPRPCGSISTGAALCTSVSLCVGFLFNIFTTNCQMLNNGLTNAGSSAISPWKYFVREPRVCPVGWVEFNYVCYYFHNAGGSWDWAKNQCHALGAKFVQITTEEEDDFIRNHIYHIGYTNFGNRDFWVGGTDIAVEGEWRWIETGELYTYAKWGPNNPDNNGGNQHCGILYQPTGYLWHDTECTNTNSYICEL